MIITSVMPYPRQDEIAADEDGVGYALRMGVSNGLTFGDLVRGLATPAHPYIPAKASNTIAFMFGGTPERVRRAFVDRYFFGGSRVASFLGHRFLRTHHLQQSSPRVCVSCLSEEPYIRAIWSFNLITACPKHSVRLTEVCGSCGRRIRWSRPAVDYCRCGTQLSPRFLTLQQADTSEIFCSEWLANALGIWSLSRGSNTPMGRQLSSLSADVLLRLIWAFGVLQTPDTVIRDRQRHLPLAQSSSLVGRAISRIEALLQDAPSLSYECVHAASVQAMYTDASSPQDLQFLTSLVTRLQQSGLPLSLRHPDHVRKQLSLFQDREDHSTKPYCGP